MKKRDYIIIVVIFIVLIVVGVFLYIGYKKTEENSDPSINILNTVKTRIADVDWSSYTTQDVKLDKTYTITTEGIFHLTGEIKDGFIKINTKGKVKLILDNVKITNSEGPAIYVENAKRVEIELADKSTNTLNDSKEYKGIDADACIYSKDDLVITGNGTINISANHGLGIHSKDDLKINSGNINIKSVDDGILGKDSIEVVSGNINIETEKNGLKSTNTKDYDKGFIIIRDGNINLKSKLDGIQTESVLYIENGNINIKTTGNPKEKINGKSISSKGLKGESIVIESGNINLDTMDDAIHSNDYVTISDISCKINTGDDAIHANKRITTDGGNIEIEESYEGIEADQIIINKGNIKVNASDDGINAASSENDKDDTFHDGPKRGKDMGSSSLEINGGDIYVNALGDGIDVNGSITINGGKLIVEGPQDNANAAVDFDNELIINGGEIIAVGYSGMAEGISKNSKQVGILINTDDTYDEKIILKDSAGKEIMSYTPSKKYNSILISFPDIKVNNEYSLYIGKEKIETIKVDSVDTVIGNNRGGGMIHRQNKGGRR